MLYVLASLAAAGALQPQPLVRSLPGTAQRTILPNMHSTLGTSPRLVLVCPVRNLDSNKLSRRCEHHTAGAR